jgi:outer membrane protein TolC
MNLEDFEKKDLESNLEIQSLNQKTEAQEKQIKISRAAYFPKISLTGGFEEEKKINKTERGYLGFVENNWNLYRGGRDWKSVDVSKIDFEVSRLDLEQKKRDTIAKARELYFKQIYFNETRILKERELQFNSMQKGRASKKVDAGLTSEVDKIEFELREDSIHSTLRNIDGEKARNLQEIVTLLSSSQENPQDSFDLIGSLPEPAKLSINSAIALQDKNITVKRTEFLEEKAQLEKNIAFGEFLPELNFKASYGRLTPKQDGFGRNVDESIYSLLLTIPIFTGFDTVGKNQALVSQVSSREKEKRQARIEFETELKNLSSEYNELFDLYEINEKRLVRAEKYYKITLSEYGRGIKNSPDLVGATEGLFSTRSRKIELLKDLAILRAKLYKINGS